MSYSRSSCSRYGSGYSRTNPVAPSYEGPVTTGTTDEILDLRRQIKHLDRQAAARTRGRHHWTNIQSGSDITNEFNRKYPSLSTTNQSHLEPDTRFPYPMIRPPPAPPSSTLCYSNIAVPSYSNVSYYQPQRVSFQTCCSKSHNQHYSDDDSFDESSNYDDERIKKALQHIDHASRILENY